MAKIRCWKKVMDNERLKIYRNKETKTEVSINKRMNTMDYRLNVDVPHSPAQSLKKIFKSESKAKKYATAYMKNNKC